MQSEKYKKKNPPTCCSILEPIDCATMADTPTSEPVRFPVVVNVNGVQVEVVLLLKPGTTVTVAEQKTTTEPSLKDHDG